MKQRILAMAMVALVCGLALAACAEGTGADRFLGTWTAEGVVVELWQEDGEIACCAVFQTDEAAREVWEYSACWYDEAEDVVQCGGITRTREVFDPAQAEWVELDWAMDDMNFARFEFSDSDLALQWTDDGLQAPVALARQVGENLFEPLAARSPRR